MPRSSVPFLAVVAALSITHAALATDIFGPIQIGANRSKYVGARPLGVVFTGNINLNSPNPKGLSSNYYWTRSDGAKGPVKIVRPSPSENMVIVKEQWTPGAAGQHYDLTVKLFVNFGNTHLEQ